MAVAKKSSILVFFQLHVTPPMKGTGLVRKADKPLDNELSLIHFLIDHLKCKYFLRGFDHKPFWPVCLIQSNNYSVVMHECDKAEKWGCVKRFSKW